MEKYFLFAFRLESGKEIETIYEKELPSFNLSLDMFFSLVGQISTAYPSCSVVSYDCADSPYIRKIRISSGDVKIFIYLQ